MRIANESNSHRQETTGVAYGEGKSDTPFDEPDDRSVCSTLAEVFDKHDVKVYGISLVKEQRFLVGRQVTLPRTGLSKAKIGVVWRDAKSKYSILPCCLNGRIKEVNYFLGKGPATPLVSVRFIQNQGLVAAVETLLIRNVFVSGQLSAKQHEIVLETGVSKGGAQRSVRRQPKKGAKIVQRRF